MDGGLSPSSPWTIKWKLGEVLLFGYGVTLAILHNSGKLPEVKRARNILANLGEIKSAVFFKNKGNIFSGSEPPLESGSLM